MWFHAFSVFSHPSTQHIPPSFPLNTFLPLLALLLHQIELLMPPEDDPGAASSTAKHTSEQTSTTKLSPALRKQMCASYITMDKMNRSVLRPRFSNYH